MNQEEHVQEVGAIYLKALENGNLELAYTILERYGVAIRLPKEAEQRKDNL